MTGATIELLTRADAVDERALFVPDIAANRIRGIMLQPDPVQTSNLIAQLAVAGQDGTTTSDLASQLAQALSLEVSGLTFTAQPGQRTVFGCSAALRNTLSPEHGALTFAAKAELNSTLAGGDHAACRARLDVGRAGGDQLHHTRQQQRCDRQHRCQ